MRRHTVTLFATIGFLIGLLVSCLTGPPPTLAACMQTAKEWYNPTGWEGCTVYGTGLASHYEGPGVARNDCLYPWTACEPIRITSLTTGRSIVVTPVMFCDCYHGTGDERLVDLDPTAVRALGLDWSTGLYPVRVEPAGRHGHVEGNQPAIPDTAMR
jgi:hypothetical protein